MTVADLLEKGFPSVLQAESLDKSVLSGDKMVSALKQATLKVENSVKFSDLYATLGTVTNPLQAATAFITAKHRALGGDTGFLGTATTPVTVCPDDEGYFRHFQNGSIYWHPLAGAHEVHGLIRAKWSGMGWERSFLGYPTTDETDGRNPQAAGRYNHFQGGSIYWTAATGAHEVHGAIRQRYLALGAEASFLGYPTTDETPTPDTIGRFNHFQAGSIYWTPSTSAHEVHGLIRNLWAAGGWERNPEFGYPITDELIPDRRLGHVRPETARKPVLNLAPDVIKLPAEAAVLSIPRSVINARLVATQPATAHVNPSLNPASGVAAAVAASGLSTTVVLPHIDPAIILNAATSTEAPQKSLNRFADFENGVIFWKRGQTSAQKLAPWLKASDGTKMTLAPQEVATAAMAYLGGALRATTLNLIGMAFAGTAPVWYDGSGVHNRKHRLNASLMGIGTSGWMPVPITAQVELRVEVAFEPAERKAVAFFTDWSLITESSAGGLQPPLDRRLRQALDPMLWTRFDLLSIRDTDAGAPIAVLSVKTMPDGNVNVFIEPA